MDKSGKNIIDNNVPDHIAIIMDGNGRWAQKNSLPRIAGHKEGISSVRAITKKCDVIFSGLPHAASAEQIKTYFNDKVKILDLSADFRLNNLEEYTK